MLNWGGDAYNFVRILLTWAVAEDRLHVEEIVEWESCNSRKSSSFLNVDFWILTFPVLVGYVLYGHFNNTNAICRFFPEMTRLVNRSKCRLWVIINLIWYQINMYGDPALVFR